MTDLTIDEKRDLLRSIDYLAQMRRDQERAAWEREEANARWNAARTKAAQAWVYIVEAYGEENAPRWSEVLYGPRPAVRAAASLAAAQGEK